MERVEEGRPDVGLLGELQPLRADNAVQRRRPRTYIRGLCNELLAVEAEPALVDRELNERLRTLLIREKLWCTATDPPSSSLAAVLLLRWALACTERVHSPSAGGFRESTHFVR